MGRTLLLVASCATLALACIIPPADAEQIRRLVEERADAVARGDGDALYRLHDLDFRAVCPRDRFTLAPGQRAAPFVREIEIRGVRAWATAEVTPNDGAGERLAFVKDGGRWYLYEETMSCLRRSRRQGSRSGSTAGRSRERRAWNSRPRW